MTSRWQLLGSTRDGHGPGHPSLRDEEYWDGLKESSRSRIEQPITQTLLTTILYTYIHTTQIMTASVRLYSSILDSPYFSYPEHLRIPRQEDFLSFVATLPEGHGDLPVARLRPYSEADGRGDLTRQRWWISSSKLGMIKELTWRFVCGKFIQIHG